MHARHVLALGFVSMFAPLVASAVSISVQSLSPGTQVQAKNLTTFIIKPEGFIPLSFKITDSFSPTTLTNDSINGAGSVSWVPVASDVGTHNLTITANDYSGNSAQTTQSITVLPPPSVTINALSPGNKVPIGGTLTFVAQANGFTSPTYSIGDSFAGTSLQSANINSSGNFSWTPDQSQNGEHTVTVYVGDSQGHNASIEVPVTVGLGSTLLVQNVTPSNSIKPGQQVSFSATPVNFSPSSFGLQDSFQGSTLANSNISATGQFAWSPTQVDIGYHTVTITGTVGFYGKKASTSVSIIVLNLDGTTPPAPVTAATTATMSEVAASGATPSTGSTGSPQTSSGQAGTATPDVASLQAQLAALQAKLAGMAPAATSASAPAITAASAPSSDAFMSYLKQGSESDEVLRLQQLLQKQGFLTVKPNGYFGPSTLAAVMAFQEAHALSQTGTVGPQTRMALNAAAGGTVAGASTSAGGTSGYVFTGFLEKGDKGEEVSELQKKLKDLGYFDDEPSGYFGSVTELAVMAFQKANGIRMAGYVGPSTRDALNK